MSRAISGREEPRDTLIDARYERTNDQVGELMGGGAFMVIASVTGAGVFLWVRSQARKHKPEKTGETNPKAA